MPANSNAIKICPKAKFLGKLFTSLSPWGLRVPHFFTLSLQSVMASCLPYLGVVCSFPSPLCYSSPGPQHLVPAMCLPGGYPCSLWSASYLACWKSWCLWITHLMLHISRLSMSSGTWPHPSSLTLLTSSPSTHPQSRQECILEMLWGTMSFPTSIPFLPKLPSQQCFFLYVPHLLKS